jgi:hypothetical protein
MFVELFEEEMAAIAQDEEHMSILACMSGLYAEKAIGRHGGSAPGRRKCKMRQRMEGYCMLYADYFADSPLHGEAVFRHRFRMSRKLFLKIVYALREYDSYFRCKLDCTAWQGFSPSKSARWLCGCWHMELMVILPMTIFGWRSPPPLIVSTGFAGR